jgi:hypothetical protein
MQKQAGMCRYATYRLKFVPPEYKTLELCRAAVRQNQSARCFVPHELREKLRNRFEIS